MAINHKAAKEFAKRWAGKTWSEDQFAGVFWIDLLKSVYDIECNDTSNVIFEYRTSASGKIDLWLRNLSTMVEMKSSGVDLDKPEPRQGEMKTPFKQVYDYAVSFPRSEQPDYLITCNFEKFRVYSRKEYGDLNLESKAQEFTVEELGDKPEYLSFLIDPQNSRLYHERAISEQAGQLIGKLYDMLREQYIDPDSEESKHSLNVLCVRLVFCLFCEDAGLFNEMDAFYNFLKDVPAANIRINLQRLFKNLDIPKDNRDKYDEAIKVFPYVNGGLFREDVEIPNFTDEIKLFLLDELSQNVDWSKISPTIFGGIFESTLNPETRRKGGMHYTSPENIHKVIDPLFLNDLKKEFADIRDSDEYSVIQKNNRYKKLHHKICNLTFLDPAAGSGNFLTETYICLRQLEFAIISELKRGKNIGMFDSATEGDIQDRVKLSQFYGIEINDFAVAVAETALWISRLKANTEGVIVYDLDEHDFPLEERANIICENALRFDWNDLIEPSQVSYILGNPPFVGHRNVSDEQKEDMKRIFHGKQGRLDYVSAWYSLAADYIANTDIECAFVSTNTVVQGVHLETLWTQLLNQHIVINFAHKSFVWDSESNQKAHVHCVIIGFSKKERTEKYLFDGMEMKVVEKITPYLSDSSNDVIVKSSANPICADIPKMIYGNIPRDGGYYTFDTISEVKEFVSQEPKAEKYIYKFIGAREYINSIDRWFLFIEECSPEELQQMPVVLDRVSKVRDFRLSSKAKEIQKFAQTPTMMAQHTQPIGIDFIAVPIVSSERRQYVPIGYVSGDTITNNQIQIIPSATVYHFGVLTSFVHMAWMRAVAGRLKSDYRYSKDIVYNNFPWPSPSDEQRRTIEQTAQRVLDVRLLYPDKSLANLYDPVKMPTELKIAHEANDKAVMDAYGFSYDKTEPEIVSELMKMYKKLTEQL